MEENPYQTTLTSILSLQGRGSKKSLLPWREKARMRGIVMMLLLHNQQTHAIYGLAINHE
jgi:hypothetical protein